MMNYRSPYKSNSNQLSNKVSVNVIVPQPLQHKKKPRRRRVEPPTEAPPSIYQNYLYGTPVLASQGTPSNILPSGQGIVFSQPTPPTFLGDTQVLYNDVAPPQRFQAPTPSRMGQRVPRYDTVPRFTPTPYEGEIPAVIAEQIPQVMNVEALQTEAPVVGTLEENVPISGATAVAEEIKYTDIPENKIPIRKLFR